MDQVFVQEFHIFYMLYCHKLQECLVLLELEAELDVVREWNHGETLGLHLLWSYKPLGGSINKPGIHLVFVINRPLDHEEVHGKGSFDILHPISKQQDMCQCKSGRVELILAHVHTKYMCVLHSSLNTLTFIHMKQSDQFDLIWATSTVKRNFHNI